MSPIAPLLVLVCVFAQACQPEAERRASQVEGPSSAPPIGPVSVSEWVASLGPAAASERPIAAKVPASEEPTNGADPEGDPAIPELAAAPPEMEPRAEPETEIVEHAIADEGETPEGEPTEQAEPTGQAERAEQAATEEPTEAAAPGPRRPERSLDELIREVAQTPTRDELEQARRLNKNGLGKHRRGELEAAIADYEAALEVAPAHVFSRYNLACALALTERPAKALLHLSVLAHQAEQDRPARERLEAARIDKDFELLRRDSRFRELTLAASIQVTWPADGADTKADREAAEAVHKALREARWDSQLARAPWRGEATNPALLVRAGADPLDLRAARAIHEELEVSHPGRFGLELDAALPSSGPPLVLLVSASGERQAAPEPLPPEPGGPDESPIPDDPRPLREQLEPFLGKRVSAMGHGVVEHLELRPAGFFSWERREAKSRIQRQGRWELTADGLALEYSARITEGDPPSLVVKDGQRSQHTLKVIGQTLVFDGRAFR
jgi:hypothetical protein